CWHAAPRGRAPALPLAWTTFLGAASTIGGSRRRHWAVRPYGPRSGRTRPRRRKARGVRGLASCNGRAAAACGANSAASEKLQPRKPGFLRAMLLQLKQVSRSFGGLMAVRGVDLTVQSGEILGLIGPNGAGKTTLFNLITGTFRPTRGSI